MKTYNEWFELRELNDLPKPGVKPTTPPVGKLVSSGPSKPTPVGKPTDEDLWRITKGQFTPEEQAIVAKQQRELKRYGVVFTPFRFYGGMKNPQFDPTPFQFK